MLLKRGGGAECCLRHCTTRRTVSYKASGPDASGMYDASYSVVQGVGARRVGDVRRVGRYRGPTRRKIPTSTVVGLGTHDPPTEVSDLPAAQTSTILNNQPEHHDLMQES